MVSKNLMIGIVAAVVVIGIAAVFMVQTPAPSPQTAAPAPGAGMTKIKITLEEERGGRKWVPSTVTVKVGADVELTVENEDDETVHQLVIPDLKVDTGKIQPGKEVTVRFKPDKAGRFQFSDPLPDEKVGAEDVKHSQEKGILVVEP
jgi:plastocyanin